MQPDELWKISVIRGGVRFAFVILWIGLYGAMVYEHVPNLWVFRQLFYATIAAICINLSSSSPFILIGNYQIENSLEFMLKTGLDAEGNPIQQSGWKPRVASTATHYKCAETTATFGIKRWTSSCDAFSDSCSS